jgi:hypothetical protein
VYFVQIKFGCLLDHRYRDRKLSVVSFTLRVFHYILHQNKRTRYCTPQCINRDEYEGLDKSFPCDDNIKQTPEQEGMTKET